MNPEVANELYELYYEEHMVRSEFDTLLNQGLEIVASYPEISQSSISRNYGTDEALAYKIALQYNEQIMVNLLSRDYSLLLQ